MSFTLVRLACFRLGMAPLNPMMRGQDARTALPKTDRHIRPEKCPGISGITVPYLLKSLSANYRNRCPRFSETRKHTVAVVYPENANIDEGRISVLTPVGVALLGLSPGATISWVTRDDETRQLEVLEVRPPSIHD